MATRFYCVKAVVARKLLKIAGKTPAILVEGEFFTFPTGAVLFYRDGRYRFALNTQDGSDLPSPAKLGNEKKCGQCEVYIPRNTIRARRKKGSKNASNNE